MTLTIGLATPASLWPASWEEKQELVGALAAAGVDQVYMADHVSFRDGSGTDGFVEVAALSQLHPTMRVMISVYLLALRHPMPVARQLATMHRIAPGRMTLGVGVGGDDRHEIEVCGVDPRTRGRRTDESLAILRRLMTGEAIDHGGDFYELQEARIQPAIDPPIPIIIGGRSDAALRRAARLGDGWIGAWCSPRRFTEAVALIKSEAADAGRGAIDWQHGYQPWVGVADSTAEARALVAAEMEAFYKVPFEAFEKYTPYGTPDDVAAALQPYVDAGASMLNLKVVAGTDDEVVAATAELVSRLRS